MASNPERRKMLEQLLPEGIIVTRKWLTENVELAKHAIDNLVKSEQLRLVRRGVYTRGSVRLTWQSIVYTLQTIMKTDYVVGGLTALELKGFSHYIPSTKKEIVHLYGNDKLPVWVHNVLDNTLFVRHTRNELFENMPSAVANDFTITVPWKEGAEELKISCSEKACLEMLNEVPKKISFEHAGQLIQGMITLSPRALQKLMEHCTNIKVKRLFLWFASRYNYTWFSKLKIDRINLGSGNRMIVKGGELDKTYRITIPKNFQS